MCSDYSSGLIRGNLGGAIASQTFSIDGYFQKEYIFTCDKPKKKGIYEEYIILVATIFLAISGKGSGKVLQCQSILRRSRS